MVYESPYQVLGMVYVSPNQVLGQVQGKGVQVSLTNLPTKNGTQKWCMYLPIKY